MRLVWMALLAGCGFESRQTGGPDVDADVDVDATVDIDASIDDAPEDAPDGPGCATLTALGARAQFSTCPIALAAPITISSNTELNTDTGLSLPEGFACASLRVDIRDGTQVSVQDVCVIAANSIT